MPAYVIMQQKALMGIVNLLPDTPQALEAVPYFGAKGVEKYGHENLGIVRKYMRENQVKRPEIKEIFLPEKSKRGEKREPKKDTKQMSYEMFCKGTGAGTSAMLANAIKEGAAQTGENIASSAGAYGQHTAIMDQYDVIVLAPQVRSYYNDMKADTDRLGIKLLAPRGKEYIDLTRDPAGAIKWLRENLD